MMRSPFVRETEGLACIRKDVIQMKLLDKLSDEAIQPLNQERRYIELLDTVNCMSAR